MRTIRNTDAQMLISEQKHKIPELLKKHRPNNAEQGMYLAFRIANRVLAECPKAKPYWRDAKENPPTKNGLYIATLKKPDGKLSTRTVFFLDGKWLNDWDITHWTLMPPPCKEDSE